MARPLLVFSARWLSPRPTVTDEQDVFNSHQDAGEAKEDQELAR